MTKQILFHKGITYYPAPWDNDIIKQFSKQLLSNSKPIEVPYTYNYVIKAKMDRVENGQYILSEIQL